MSRRQRALLLTEGFLSQIFAKTAHGILRGPSRYELVGVVDSAHAGQTVGDVLPMLTAGGAQAGPDGGRSATLPIFRDLTEAAAAIDEAEAAEVLIVGIATPGGTLSEPLRVALLDGARQGLVLVNGLHQLLEDDEEIVGAARASGAELVDVRKPPSAGDLSFWSGEVLRCSVPRVAILGIDCAVGKRTTTSLLVSELRQRGVNATMIYTGQTGWLQGWRHGLILDAVPNDFVCGELERAILECVAEEAPDVILLEGQSGLRNPSGPCGGELLLAAGASGAILQVAPGRPAFKGLASMLDEVPAVAMPTVRSEVALIEAFGVGVWGVGVHPEGLDPEAARAERDRLATELGIPVALPFEDGVGALAEAVVRHSNVPVSP
ncbi:MAG: DUF1611 domain-containing protein [Thermoanaerobaculia bacterium]|nr:DUF1611 domain-containing protein [Thermoanaerobaculia bacterium]